MSDTNERVMPAAAEPEAYTGGWSGGGPGSESELKFERRPMVKWLDPKQLCGTAVRAVLSDVFGAYADQREMQAALTDPGRHEYDVLEDGKTAREEIWIDYVADLGDGFDSTYTVAWALAQPGLEVDGVAEALPRGSVLLMGGDQVYPTASRQEYNDRMAGPYEAALPCHLGPGHPHLFAIPGNHDWYDGLTSFMRQFCQQRWIGGWETRQTRSYFALKLPHNWWLMGTDLQLRADIDKPQLDYFCEIGKQIRPGDRVILCTPEPSWVHTHEKKKADAFDNLAFFEQKVIADRGATLALTLTGDLHHYARYADAQNRRHKITAGGGGAYLYGTHRLPRELLLRKAIPKDPQAPRTHAVQEKEVFREQRVYPDRRASLRLRQGALFGFLKNPWFAVLLAGFYTVFTWFLQTSGVRLRSGETVRFLEHVAGFGLAGWEQVPISYLTVLRFSPSVVVLTLLLIAGLLVFCEHDPGRWRGLKALGLVHALAHLTLAVGLAWVFTRLNVRVAQEIPALRAPEKDVINSIWFPIVFTVEMIVFGGGIGGLLMGLFMLPGVNLNEAFSSQHLSRYRNFLRLHIDRGGNLTVYPIGIDHAVEWKFRKDAPSGAPFFQPKHDPPRPRLIEAPIAVDRLHVRVPAIVGDGDAPTIT